MNIQRSTLRTQHAPRMNTLYGAKVNQVKMMRHRGFTNRDTYILAGGAESDTVEFEPFDDDAAIESEEHFMDNVYMGSATNLVTFYITPSPNPIGDVVNDIVMVYWAEELEKDKIGKAFIAAATDLQYRINTHPDMTTGRIKSVVFIGNKPLNPDAMKESRMDLGVYMQVFGFIDLMPLTHIQRVPMRLMTAEELKRFPYADSARMCPCLYIDDREVLYNGIGPNGKWLPGNFVRCDRTLPKATSFAEKSIMFRAITSEFRPKIKIPS